MNERKIEMSTNPEPKHTTFQELLKKFNDLHKKKNEDYSGDRGQYFNFEYAATMIAPMVKDTYDPIHVVFITMYGIKIAREIVLLEHGRTANNESILDTFDDHAIYAIIHDACMRDHLTRQNLEEILDKEDYQNKCANIDTDTFKNSYIEPIETPGLDKLRPSVDEF